MQKSDALWKGLIEDLFPWFIPFFLPQYETEFDTSKPVSFLDKELQQLYPETSDDSNLRFVDKLVKVFTRNGEERWILIHIEVQGYVDKSFGERMFTYYYRLRDRYKVPVTAIAIFTDDKADYHTSEYTSLFAGTELVYRYNTYKVHQQDEAQLLASQNPFAVVILTTRMAIRKRKPDGELLLSLKVALVRQMYAKGFTPAATRQLLNFVKLYVHFAKPDTGGIFDEAIKPLTRNNRGMGLEEQILEMKKQEGAMEQSKLFVENLLRSTDFSNERIAALAAVSVTFVQKIKAGLK